MVANLIVERSEVKVKGGVGLNVAKMDMVHEANGEVRGLSSFEIYIREQRGVK